MVTSEQFEEHSITEENMKHFKVFFLDDRGADMAIIEAPDQGTVYEIMNAEFPDAEIEEVLEMSLDEIYG